MLSHNNTGYCPTIYYSYEICENAQDIVRCGEKCLNSQGLPKENYVLKSKDITEGYDSIGCLFNCSKGNSYWMGTIVDNEDAYKISPEINATTQQVGIHLLASVIWMINHPYMGVIEPEYLDTEFILGYCKDYFGQFYWKKVEYRDEFDNQFTTI